MDIPKRREPTHIVGREQVDLIQVNEAVLAALTAITHGMPAAADAALAEVWTKGPQHASALAAVLAVRLQGTLAELAAERDVPLGEALASMGARLANVRVQRDIALDGNSTDGPGRQAG